MLVNIFCSSILLIVSWLTYQIHENNRALAELETQLQQITLGMSRSLRADLSLVSNSTKSSSDAIITHLDSYIEQQQELEKTLSGMEDSLKFAKAELQSKSTKLQTVEKRRLLEQALSTVMQAELFNIAQNAQGAKDTLLSTKDAIWKSSGNFPDHADALKKLMGPIDVLAGKWGSGQHNESSVGIRTTLENVLASAE